ncbi:cytochrome P450 [Trametes sanguinea]|nr:cytochrome P450 [Trametes sanguinea]
MPSVEYHWCTIACIISFTSFLCLNFAQRHSRAENSLPPGPPRSPLIGNLINAPRARKPWVAFRHLMQTYGDIVYLEVLGRRMLLLGNPSDILGFLDKRSSITSDRAYSPLISLAGQAYNFGFMPYGQWWRRHRRMFWQQFHPGVVSRYWPIQKSRTPDFLVKLLEQPTSCQELIRYCFSTTALKVVYNVDIDDVHDTRLGIIEELFVGIREVTISVQLILESFPFVQHLPTWTPGIGKFLKQISRSKIPNEQLIASEFTEARARAEKNGAEDPSVVSQMLHRLAQTAGSEDDVRDEEEEIVKDVAGVAMEAGTDTTFSTAEGFFVAMSLHPEVQQKARAELDLIVGPHRLPDFSDRDSLVYININAIVKESLRWHNVLPLGISHNTTEDAELHGYHIPAGTAVVPNIWACMHDPRFYPEPERFNPDRFISDGQLNEGALDPSDFAFGFGRRICPGRHFADAGLFIAIASVLHVFEIVPPLDEDGRPVKVEYEQCHGFLSYPENFACVVKPRSEDAISLIRGLRPANDYDLTADEQT